MGYDKQQVDNYIARLVYEYQSMQNEYTALVSKCNNLSETCARLTDENKRANATPGGKNADAVSRAIIDAEIMAKQIVDNANAENAQIQKQIQQAKEELQQVQMWKNKALAEVHEMRKKLNSFFQE
jgi:cell division septum initiation protein DivIVA